MKHDFLTIQNPSIDLLEAYINDEDTTDEEIENNADIPNSDEEQDPIVFLSDDEDNKLESDYESTDAEDSEDNETNNSYIETQEKSQITLKDNKNKLKITNKGKESKATISTRKEISLKNDKNSKNSEALARKDDSCKKTQTKNMSRDEDEYEYDSSDEEDIPNTVGNVPMKWYDDYDHLGYNWDGKKIPKPEKGDELDNFLKRMEDPDFWRTIKDAQTGQNITLSEADIDLIVRIQKQKVPDVQFDEYAVSYTYNNLTLGYIKDIFI